MKDHFLDSFVNLPFKIFLNNRWDENAYDELNREIKHIEENIGKEIDENLIGKNFIQKEDIIREYVVSLGQIYYDIFSVVFEDEEATPDKFALAKIQESYQFVIDLICHTSIKNSIDLEKIVDSNHYTFEMINISCYYDQINISFLSRGKAEATLKKFFKPDHYILFNYLNEKFGKQYTDHNKFSCIYRLMLKNGFIEDTLKPEKLKALISRSPYNATIPFSLFTESQLSKKIVNHYYSLIEQYNKQE